MNLFNGIYQINIRVTDMPISSKWYQEVLGLKVVKDYDTTVVLGFNDSSVAVCLIELAENESLPLNLENGTHPVFAIPTAQAEICKQRLTEMDVAIVAGGSEAHFKFTDPDGNLLEAFLPDLYENDAFQHLR